MQDAEVYIPVISHKYTIDLSRTRSHFLPGYPLDVVVCMKLTNGYTDMYMSEMTRFKIFCLLLLQVLLRLPDGSSAAGVPVNIKVSSSEEYWHGTTDQEGTVFPVFNIPSVAQITVEVSI